MVLKYELTSGVQPYDCTISSRLIRSIKVPAVRRYQSIQRLKPANDCKYLRAVCCLCRMSGIRTTIKASRINKRVAKISTTDNVRAVNECAHATACLNPTSTTFVPSRLKNVRTSIAAAAVESVGAVPPANSKAAFQAAVLEPVAS